MIEGDRVTNNKARVVVAATWWHRVCGFLCRRPPHCVLLIAPCFSVHTFGMKTPLDIAFFDKEGRVIASYRSVLPRRVVRKRRAYGVLERQASNQQWFTEGEEIYLWLHQK